MQANTMARAYEGLTMPERVALAFHFHAHDNELEVLRLRDAIPKSCMGRPMQALAYGIERWRSIAAFFAINHWRLRTLVNEARLASHMALNHPDPKKVPRDAPFVLVQHALEVEAKVIALDRALDTVCAEHGVDPADIRHVSATQPYCSLVPKLDPDVAFEQEMAAAMRETF